MKDEKQIGILGGTFNPIHTGHIALAKAAREQYKLDEIWVMPNYKPGYKTNTQIVSAEDRCRMIQLAIEGYDYMRLSTMELDRQGLTYTVDTLSILTTEYPVIHWYFIMGADSLFDFHKWREPAKILSMATILAAIRNDVDSQDIDTRIRKLQTIFNPCDIRLLNIQPQAASSSEIRSKLQEGTDTSELLSKAVFNYILEHGLYRYDKQN